MKHQQSFLLQPTDIQKPIIDFHKDNDISILHGAAGTGKDFIQLYAALQGLINKDYENIVFMRSPVEVGKGVGFMPGNESEKLQPYEKVFYQNLKEIIHPSVFEKIKKNIRFEHIGFVRGLTFKRSIVILSEAQNCTLHELITVCTRMSDTSKLLINGDKFQADIKNSGFNALISILKDIKGVGVKHLGDEFQMRSKLITQIDKNYQKYLQN